MKPPSRIAASPGGPASTAAAATATGNANSKTVLARLMNCEHEQRGGGGARCGVSYGRIVRGGGAGARR